MPSLTIAPVLKLAALMVGVLAVAKPVAAAEGALPAGRRLGGREEREDWGICVGRGTNSRWVDENKTVCYQFCMRDEARTASCEREDFPDFTPSYEVGKLCTTLIHEDPELLAVSKSFRIDQQGDVPKEVSPCLAKARVAVTKFQYAQRIRSQAARCAHLCQLVSLGRARNPRAHCSEDMRRNPHRARTPGPPCECAHSRTPLCASPSSLTPTPPTPPPTPAKYENIFFWTIMGSYTIFLLAYFLGTTWINQA
jgi:hypothetical protein